MIIVTGASGQIGRALVDRLDRQGVTRRAVVRQVRHLADLGGDVALADFADHRSIRAALVPGARLLLNGVPGPDFVHQQLSIIDLAAEAGVAQVVKISVRGAAPGAPLAQGQHSEIDDHLRDSGLPHTILQPVGFMQNLLTEVSFADGEGRFYGSYGPGRVGYLDARDIADVAAALLTRPVEADATLILTGPEAPTHDEVAETMTAVLGRPVRYLDLPVAAMAQRLRAAGLPPAFADDLATLMRDVGDGRWADTTDTVQTITGRPPRTLATFVTDHATSWP
ncbi:NmrA family NAD(P)-binding protein [Micromonospora endophytica]|uniref:NmrA family transcriptional regulator n=1 Tax=Micromonospora endophytica TaxID=515350 RepID=A0A2W2E300_9ACTN|nr:NmrA family NAD(P)-binding protein [Micromonospora endophytica]PZF99323.1 NmrA family transcriptional regulator [Micromonospora endophytica]RIW43033.1 NAD-dependent epimerase/dehydratase family protein [Micromonospora endophytica]BCJ61303.1 NAD(P)-dependent oxidoreductase [Micromonospora endophytica]